MRYTVTRDHFNNLAILELMDYFYFAAFVICFNRFVVLSGV